MSPLAVLLTNNRLLVRTPYVIIYAQITSRLINDGNDFNHLRYVSRDIFSFLFFIRFSLFSLFFSFFFFPLERTIFPLLPSNAIATHRRTSRCTRSQGFCIRLARERALYTIRVRFKCQWEEDWRRLKRNFFIQRYVQTIFLSFHYFFLSFF